ncbi:MAG: ketopantoate reductase family protein [Rhizobiales bacterium]|nr:ketopantoate reductase family protein [Hyphomicrobiales bacterium]
MRILCLGAGALGGYFGGRLVEGGADVEFLVREARKARIVADGLRIESKYGNCHLNVKAVTAEEAKGPYDIVLLTCKAYDLPGAIATIAPFVGPDTAVLPLLNGVAHMAVLNEKFGRERVLGGVAKISATLAPDGAIKHLNDWRYITMGEQSGAMSARVLGLKAAFDKTSVIATAVPNIMQMMWEKVVHLSTVAGMTCAMRASVGDIARTQDGTAMMIQLLERNAEIAGREGHAPSEAFLAEYRQLFHDTSSPYMASMLRDIERGGPIEADHILGFMLQKARQHGVDPVLHQFIFVHVQAYEQRRAAMQAKAAA